MIKLVPYPSSDTKTGVDPGCVGPKALKFWMDFIKKQYKSRDKALKRPV